jgi:hypothetical protein
VSALGLFGLGLVVASAAVCSVVAALILVGLFGEWWDERRQHREDEEFVNEIGATLR